jgi:hypothetical protein
MSTTRRGFLLGLGGGALGAAAAGATVNGLMSGEKSLDFPVKGTAFALGLYGQAHLDGFGPFWEQRMKSSVITEIDLATGKYKQTWLPMAEGHHAQRLPDGKILCIGHHDVLSMVLNPDHSTALIMRAPEGYLYGGHGQPLPELGVLIVPLRARFAKSVKDTGLLEVYDLKTLQKLDGLPSGGIHPHEVRMLPGGKEFVITHYGEVHEYQPGSPFEFNIVEPKLTVYDSKTLKPLRHYVQDVNAILTHMDVGTDGNVYAVLNQYVWDRTPPNDVMTKRKSPLEHFKDAWGTPTFNFDLSAINDKQLAIPLPMLRINPQTGEVKELFTAPETQMRSQSVAANPMSKRVFSTYTHTNTLVVSDEGGETRAIPAFDLGVLDIRGVATVPNTPYILLAGQKRGLSLVDARTLQPVRRYDIPIFFSPHLSISDV